jgi:hypothetical protein
VSHIASITEIQEAAVLSSNQEVFQWHRSLTFTKILARPLIISYPLFNSLLYVEDYDDKEVTASITFISRLAAPFLRLWVE